MVKEKRLTEEELANENTICVRCNNHKGFSSVVYRFCKQCARDVGDQKYLDEGSETVIRERADREEEVRADYFEHERELDELLEEF